MEHSSGGKGLGLQAQEEDGGNDEDGNDRGEDSGASTLTLRGMKLAIFWYVGIESVGGATAIDVVAYFLVVWGV